VPDDGDWLDGHCWRCGSDRAEHRSDGSLLCPRCLDEMFGRPAPAPDVISTVSRLRWEAHVLEKCWRCLAASVDPDDELGLCPECRQTLVLASAS
jgi:hypothetical protein